ncbi:hypothetical protein [Lignipirellula cremea]|nr:hypothetical protein [Lignipirellula cremea]
MLGTFRSTTAWLWFAVMICVAIWPASVFAQTQIRVLENLSLQGEIRSVSPGVIAMVESDGTEHTFKIQEKDEQGVSLAGAAVIINLPAKVSLTGQKDVADIKPNELLRFRCLVNRFGATDGELQELESVESDAAAAAGLEVVRQADTAKEFSDCTLTGTFSRLINGRLLINTPKSSLTSRSPLSFKVADNATVKFSSDDYRRASRGDKIVKLIAMKLSTGDSVIRELEIVAGSQTAARTSAEDELLAKYRALSDEPSAPRDVRSRNFLLHTDLSDRESQILLDKLETMITLVSGYFNAPPGGLIECYVVQDLTKWPANSLDAGGAAKIQAGEGVTMSRSLGRTRRSIVYSCDKHTVVQHEAIHAYCFLTFGSTGPTWYSEGVAELGAYWKRGNLAVNIDPVVIDYLKNAPPKGLLEIVAAGQITGDSWQAYAWRWALCHMLAQNPNYAERFKTLGIAMMNSTPGAAFEGVYGPVAKEISFEYDRFVENLDNGYRADLCAWQWNKKFTPLGANRTKTQVKAQAGWQPSGVRLDPNVSYDAAAVGNWTILADGEEITADGDSSGKGRLLGVIVRDFQMGEPFEIGCLGTFSTPTGGDLYLRCGDSWNRIADNDGELTVWLRRTP